MNPVSVVVAHMFMAALEQSIMSSTPPGVKHKIWQVYIKDSFKVVKKEQRDV